MDNEIAPVLLILAAPDELRVEIAISIDYFGAVTSAVAWITNLLRCRLLLLDKRLLLDRRNILALGLVVLEGFDGFERGWFLGHDLFRQYEQDWQDIRWKMTQGFHPVNPVHPVLIFSGDRYESSV